jgi:hypothetical protein
MSFCKESNNYVCDKIVTAEFRILSDTPFDLIIGRSTTKKFKLSLVLPSHFFLTCVIVNLEIRDLDLQARSHRWTPLLKLPNFGCNHVGPL